MRPASQSKIEIRPQPHRIWEYQPVIMKIVEEVPIEDHPSLAAVSQNFAAAVNRPSIWARKNAPSQIDFDNQQVLTAAPALGVPDPYPFRLKRPLGKFEGEPWKVLTGHVPALPDHSEDLARIDQACERIFFSDVGIKNYLGALDLDDEQWAQHITFLREQTHLLLVQRGFKRYHNHAHKDVFDPTALAFWPASAFLIYAIRGQAQIAALHPASALGQLAMAFLLPEAMVAFALLFYFVKTDGEPLAEFARGPLKFTYLNREADYFYQQALQRQIQNPEAYHLSRSFEVSTSSTHASEANDACPPYRQGLHQVPAP